MINIVAPNHALYLRHCKEHDLKPGTDARAIIKPDDLFGVSGEFVLAVGATLSPHHLTLLRLLIIKADRGEAVLKSDFVIKERRNH